VITPDTGVATSTVLEDLMPGNYQLELADVAPNCAITSQGGRRARLTVPPDGGVTVNVRMTCSDESRRPRLLDVHATFEGRRTAVTFSATDPNRDVDWYYWDVTDCAGYSVLQAGQVSRRGIVAARGYQDTVRVAAVFDVGADTASFQGRCVAIRTWDAEGNSTAVQEVPLSANAGGPAVRSFNALIPGAQSSLEVAIATDVPFFAIFPTIRVRDGVLGAPDGVADIGIYNVAGYPTTTLPPVPLGGRLQWYDVLASEVFVLDAQANFTTMRDDQLSR
jgi:hypothetical protein